MSDATLFLAMSFCLFVVGAFWKGKHLFYQTVDGYIHTIEQEFDQLRVRVAELQAEFERIPDSWDTYDAHLKSRQAKHAEEKRLFLQQAKEEEQRFIHMQQAWFEAQWQGWIRAWSLGFSESIFESALHLLPLNPASREPESLQETLEALSPLLNTPSSLPKG